jgi:antitoxin ParD1/3/4
MNLSLHADLQKFVDQQVKAGHYDSADDLINSAVARLQAEEDLSAAELADLRAEIVAGIEEADRGDTEDWAPETLKRRVHEHLETKKAQ